jgi:hypothetical protein
MTMSAFGPTSTSAVPFMDTKFALEVTEGKELRPSGANQDLLLFDFWVGASAIPGPGTFPATTWGGCIYCMSMFLGCTSTSANYGGVAPTTCTEGYLAQSGSYNLTSLGGADGGTGSVVGTFSSVNMVQWDFVSDMQVAGGKCISLGGASINASW